MFIREATLTSWDCAALAHIQITSYRMAYTGILSAAYLDHFSRLEDHKSPYRYPSVGPARSPDERYQHSRHAGAENDGAPGLSGGHPPALGDFPTAERLSWQALALGRTLNIPLYLCEYLHASTDRYAHQQWFAGAQVLNEEALQMATRIERTDIQFRAMVLAV